MKARIVEELRKVDATPKVFGAVSPMLCTRVEDSPRFVEETGWSFEPKLDGGRVIAHLDSAGTTLRYRSEIDCTHVFPEVVEALSSLTVAAVFDGEVCAFDERGAPSFAEVSTRFHLKNPRDVKAARARCPVTYFAFDIVSLEGYDLTRLPIEKRRELLNVALPKGPSLRVVDAFDDGRMLLAFAKEHGLEGLVAKRNGSPYVEGPRRTDYWRKMKFEHEGDFVVLGWTSGEGSRKLLGALEVGAYDGDRLVSLGRVGSGFTESQVSGLLSQLPSLEVHEPSCAIRDPKPGTRFVRPTLVVSVRYSGVTRDGSLRFPVFRGVRPDIAPSESLLPHAIASARKR